METEVMLAHVGYVVPRDALMARSGSDARFLLGALREPGNVALIFGAIVGVVVLARLARRVSPLVRWWSALERRAGTYGVFVPAILRVSVAATLIGAGVTQTLIAPTPSSFPQFALWQMALGFLLLSGLLLTPVVVQVVLLFLVALVRDASLLGNLELLGAVLALAVLADPRPGVDDLLGIPFFVPLPRLQRYAPLFLRIGIGVAMMFLAFSEKFANPHQSALVVDTYRLTALVPVSPEMWVLAAGLIEFLIGLLLFIGLRTRFVAVAALVVLTLSLFVFGEAVYAHATLFGVLGALFITGGGAFSVDERAG